MIERNSFRPHWVSAPGNTIVDLLHDKNLSEEEFAQQVGISLVASKNIFAGKTPIDSGLATKLERILGGSVKFWLTREENFRRNLRRVEDELSWLKGIPVKEMVEFGWISESKETAQQIRNCFTFFGVTDVITWQELNEKLIRASAFRTSSAFSAKLGATAAWLRQGELLANEIECENWNSEKFKNVLVGLRSITRKKNPDVFLEELQRRCASCGVAVVVVRAPTGCTHSGATRFISSNKAVLQLSFRYLSDDHFWFTFFHEAGHILLHQKNLLFLDGASKIQSKEESEADNFATNLLIPESFRQEFLSLRSNTLQVIKFARKLNISPGIVVGQLQHHGIVPRNHLNRLKKRFVWD